MSGRIVRIAIIGAGPAGGASAIHLARLGYRVTLVERKAFPRAKVCGEYISPAATEALERVVPTERLRSLGATRAGSFSLRVDDRERTWATPSEAWALSRGTLDAELAQSAQNLGVDVRLESPVRSVAYAPLGARLVLDTGTLEAALVIHADGLGRHDLAEPTRAAPGMLGHKCHALIPGGEVGVGMRAARGAYVGTVTVEGGLSTIALCAREHLIRDHRGDADAMLGALWPAYRASRLRPIEAMATRASAISNRLLVGVGVAGLLGIGAMIAIVGGSDDGQFVFWGYATIGLPAMFIGYFLVSVPAAVLCGVLLGPVISRVLGLPRGLLTRVIRATPFRHGFTAGAMMAGLALMVSIWTNGGSVMRDWLGRIEFPDAFVSGLALSPEAQARIDALPFVNATAAITLHPVEVDFFGVRALQQYKTTFVAFEPTPFMEMAALTFVEGDEDTARARLEAGGAVIVAREFRVAQGLGLGDTFICRGADGVEHEFEIVGVVTSPGLELVSKFFNIGDEFIDQALHAVFGSRKDLRERFGSDAIQLIQVDLADDADDAEAIATIRRELFGAGILDAGSGRQIKQQILTFVGGSLVVFSAVAVGSMLVACFGVANLIVAGIHARRYELGVLRAIGGSRGLLVRLVAGEAIVIALAACVVGTCMGVQAAWAGQRLYETLIGIGDLRLVPPIDAILWGCVFVLSLTLLAAAPAAAWLNRRRPVERVACGG